jgi:putative N6-adenine-specific DNA methylase
MDGFFLTNGSFSEVAKLDVRELIDKELVFDSDCDAFGIIKDSSLEDFALLSYRAQSAFKVGVFLGGFSLPKEFSEESIIGSFKDSFSKRNVEEWLGLCAGSKTFGVFVENNTRSDLYSSVEVARLIGGVLSDEFISDGLDLKVQLKQPNISFYAYLTKNRCYYGVDLTGIPLERRPYKLLTKSSSINGVFAYAIARIAGLKKDSLVLDPFCGSGTIPIEVALFQQGKSPFMFSSNFSAIRLPSAKTIFKECLSSLSESSSVSTKKRVFGFDYVLKIILSAKKNAKVAGVLDSCLFSKIDVEWMDSKFEEHDVDLIITNPPKESAKKNNKQDIKKVYDELFYQSRYVHSKEGVLAILTNKTDLLEDLAKKHGFILREKRKLFSGEQPYVLIQFNPPRPLGDDEI